MIKRIDLSIGVLLSGIIITSIVLYQKRQSKIQHSESRIYDDNEHEQILMKKMLMDETMLSNAHKPILWIHLPFETNCRKWESFTARTSNELNQPYLYLTIKSIIDNNADDFHICIIDDNTFGNIIPEWNVDMSLLGEIDKERYRILGTLKTLYYYGGLFVPPATLCFKSFKPLYGNTMMSVELPSNSIVSNTVSLTPNSRFFGSPKKNQTLSQFMYNWDEQSSATSHGDNVFNGLFERLCYEYMAKSQLELIDGKQVGTKTANDVEVSLEMLFGLSDDISMATNLYCISIPSESILNRSSYEWFASESVEDVVTSDYLLSDYFAMVYT